VQGIGLSVAGAVLPAGGDLETLKTRDSEAGAPVPPAFKREADLEFRDAGSSGLTGSHGGKLPGR